MKNRGLTVRRKSGSGVLGTERCPEPPAPLF